MNKTFGATLIVAGTTIGAGMLALPIASHSLGTLNAMLWLSAMWLLMCYAGLIHIEINLFYGRQSASISTLAGRCFGKTAESFMAVVLGGLFYALLAAYIAGGSSIVQSILTNTFELKLQQSHLTLGFTFFFAAVTAGQMKWLDYTNRVLFFIKMVVFLVLAAWLLPFINGQKLASSPLHVELTVLPILFTSFGFHGSIPSLLSYLDGNVGQIRRAFFWGTAVPLVVYILWCITTLGIIPETGPMSFASIAAANNDVGQMIKALNHWTNIPALSLCSSVFSLLAIVTSFFGVGLGLLSFFQERVKKRRDVGQGMKQTISVLLTYSVPLVFALFYPQGFIMALGYAAIALAILAITMPAAVALVQRWSKQGPENRYKAPGGIVGLSLALLASLVIIGIEALK